LATPQYNLFIYLEPEHKNSAGFTCIRISLSTGKSD